MKLPVIAIALPLLASVLTAQVSNERLLRAGEEPQNWMTYSGTYASQRYSTLRQITPANVKSLEQKWIFQAESLEKFETTPLVVDGIMYITQAPNDALAQSSLADAYAHGGRRAEAESHVQTALALAPDDSNVLAEAASVNELLGNRSAAVEQLQRAIKKGYSLEQVSIDPQMSALISDPRLHQQ